MKIYFYKRADGLLVRIECDQMFWNGTSCVFVKHSDGVAYTAGVIALLPGELIVEEGFTKESLVVNEQGKIPN